MRFPGAVLGATAQNQPGITEFSETSTALAWIQSLQLNLVTGHAIWVPSGFVALRWKCLGLLPQTFSALNPSEAFLQHLLLWRGKEEQKVSIRWRNANKKVCALCKVQRDAVPQETKWAVGIKCISLHLLFLHCGKCTHMTSVTIPIITHGTKQPGLGIQACRLLVSWHLCVYRSLSFYFAPNGNKVKQDPVFSQHCHPPKTEGGKKRKTSPAQKRPSAPVNVFSSFLDLLGKPEREREKHKC